ncbi:hypothetical protein [Psychroserpens luteolus]|uniref:hypothetical protein n=1 Tax=Psychroserpens luteolus TaxID=2855840 RepID=UPI001E426666|nr:hypothetical protein [Psychroserpens luteolus]MCD2257621.1 hypothetical protein [Psychroserpens luteolus]
MEKNEQLIKLKWYVVLQLIGFFMLSSCGKRVYTSGTYGAIKSYTAKPEYRGENKSGTYVALDLARGSQDVTNNVTDKKVLISVRGHRSITRKYFNFYYGLSATLGHYKFGGPITNEVDEDSKAFYSLNTKSGINLNLPTKKMDWRIVGVELVYNYEFGPYQNTLDKAKNNNEDPALLIFNKKSIFSYNVSTEAVFKLKNDRALGLGFYIGDILNKTGNLKDENSEFIGVSMSFRVRRFTFSLLSESGKEDIGTSKFGLTYQLF